MRFGMHEALDLHEVLSDKVCAIDHFALYESQCQDQELKSLIHRQVSRMAQDYNTLVNMARGRGVEPRNVPQRVEHPDVHYGMTAGQPTHPHLHAKRLSDQAIAQGVLLHHKCGASHSTLAALESADPDLRQMMTNCSVTAINMAYEIFQYMNAKGHYQVPQMDQRTMSQMGQSYQPVNLTGTHAGAGMGTGMGAGTAHPTSNIGRTGNVQFGGQYAGNPTTDYALGNPAEHVSPENFKM
ncbi:MAG: spore coat protein [Eubacteriales bacterium]|jgi:spore coat protein CotF|nr:spore coat protein [Bacillota bacterium]MBV1726755.1 spore coat protein [Desulforudis sp.]MDQ7789414.1 spore coat protein [Clostridia bacterium]MDZ4042968.1 spore coat protein [Eubacteriales bacterium]MBU4533178.1 spore coat protein [Bacillota bacterium]